MQWLCYDATPRARDLRLFNGVAAKVHQRLKGRLARHRTNLETKIMSKTSKTLTVCAFLLGFVSLAACTSVNSTRNGANPPEVQWKVSGIAPSRTMIVDALVRDGQLARGCVEQQAKASDLIGVQPVDLNGDGASEYLVEGQHSCACGAQRCYYWVYAVQQNKLKLLAIVEANSVEEGTAKTNGFTDLMVYNAYGGNMRPVTLKFDGASYTDTSPIRR